jgi:transcriptional regulator with XRE-family HTH domain
MNSERLMTDNDTTFFKTFGQRLTDMRKARGLTQVQLGEALGLDQTAVASYEIGRRRVPLSLLGPLAKALGVSVAELVEDEKGPGKRGPAPKLQRQLDQVTRLPQAKQKFVSEFLDTVLQAQTAG